MEDIVFMLLLIMNCLLLISSSLNDRSSSDIIGSVDGNTSDSRYLLDMLYRVERWSEISAYPDAKKNELMSRAYHEAVNKRCYFPHDCLDIQRCGHIRNGVYRIYPLGLGHGFPVYCDLSTEGGGWTVLQRRRYGDERFYRTWAEYKEGFGNLFGDFWIGLEHIFTLTQQEEHIVRVDVEDYYGNRTFDKYMNFYISGENLNYTLHIGHATHGTLGEGLRRMNGHPFSTIDRNRRKCAGFKHGGWWYSKCSANSHDPNPNGIYRMYTQREIIHPGNLCWYEWKTFHPLQFTEMKVRATSFKNTQHGK